MDLRHLLKALVDSASDFLAVCASEEFDFARADSIKQGNFVTEAGLHAGLLLDGSIEASCTIVAKDEQKTKCLRWNRTELVELLKRESGLRRAFKAILSWDIVRKLKGQRQTITDHLLDQELWTMKRKEQKFIKFIVLKIYKWIAAKSIVSIIYSV